jgi:hypothetical protein
MHSTFLSVNLHERDLDIGMRIILKLILKMGDCALDSSGSELQ